MASAHNIVVYLEVGASCDGLHTGSERASHAHHKVPSLRIARVKHCCMCMCVCACVYVCCMCYLYVCVVCFFSEKVIEIL